MTQSLNSYGLLRAESTGVGIMKIDGIKKVQKVAVVVLNWLFKEKGMLKITLLLKS